MLVTFKVKISIKHLEVTTTILLLIVLEGKLVMLVTGLTLRLIASHQTLSFESCYAINSFPSEHLQH